MFIELIPLQHHSRSLSYVITYILLGPKPKHDLQAYFWLLLLRFGYVKYVQYVLVQASVALGYIQIKKKLRTLVDSLTLPSYEIVENNGADFLRWESIATFDSPVWFFEGIPCFLKLAVIFP